MQNVPQVPSGASNALQGHPGAKKRYSTVVGKARRTRVPAAEYPSEAQLVAAITLWLETVAEMTDLKALEEAVAQQNVTAAFMSLDLENVMWQVAQGSGLSSKDNSLQDALQAVYRDGAQRGLDVLDGVLVQKARPRIGTLMTFNFLDEKALTFLKNYTFNLIRQITTETKLAIQAIMVKAFQKGGHPYKIAREIKRHIGLTVNQTAALDNYRAALESGSPMRLRRVLERELRDKRFDSTVLRSLKAKAPALTQPQIDRMVDRYRERAIKARAQTIARTETIRASNAGTQTVWDQAMAQGYLDQEATRQKWIISFDERTCPQCKSIVRLNPQGVRLQEPFQSNKGPVMVPPAHPNCRCTVGLVFA